MLPIYMASPSLSFLNQFLLPLAWAILIWGCVVLLAFRYGIRFLPAHSLGPLLLVIETANRGTMPGKISAHSNAEKGILTHSFAKGGSDVEGLIANLEKSLSEYTAELVNANEQLHKLTITIEQSPSSIIITDAETRIEYVNPAFTRITGYTLEEVRGKNPRVLKSGKTPPKIYIEMWEAISKGQIWHGELCNRRKNGEDFWEHTVISAIHDVSGKITHYVSIKEDVTAWKNMEQVLRESEKQYRDLYEMESDAIFIVRNSDQAILEANNAAEVLYGYSRAEMLELHRLDLDTEPEDAGKDFLSVTPAAQVISIPLGWHRKKDGTIFPVEITARFFAWKGEEVYIAAVRDISARLQADLRYRSIFEQSHDAIFLLDLKGKHITVNKRASELLGYTQEELLTLSVSDVSAQLAHSEGVLNKLLSGEHVPLYEWIFRKKDGSLVPVEINAELICDANKRPLYIQSIVRDITERRKAEQELIQSHERYRIVADFTSDWEYWIGPERTLLYISPSVQQMTGYSREEFIENPELLFQIIHPEDKAALEHHLHDDISGAENESFDVEFRIITKSGNIRWISHACLPAHLKDGSYAGRRAGNRDITERKRVEAENAHFSRLLENLNEVAIKLSLAPTFDEMCRQAIILGREELEFDRLGLWFIDPDDPAYMIGSFGVDENGQIRDERKIRIPTAPSELNKRLMEKRTYQYHEEKAPVFDDHNQIVGYGEKAGVGLWDANTILGFLYVDNFITRQPIVVRQRDLLRLFGQVIGHQSTIKRAEEKLKQLNLSLEERVMQRTRQLLETITELESFSYTISHNLRSPLRAINGYSNLIERNTDISPDSEIREMLNYIKNSAKLMGQMMDELLAFIQLGRKTIQKSQVNTAQLVESVLEELDIQRDNKSFQLVVHLLPACNADKLLLRQVWLNLLSNAIKYSRQREVVRIEIGSQKDDKGRSIYFVRDNGVGFDMRYYDKLFGVFHRLHHDHEFEGTGVGLAVAYRIVRMHGGRMWAESKINEGATFYFNLE